MKSPVVSIAGVELSPRPAELAPQGATAERFDARFARLGATMGLAKLGCSVTAVPPGKAAFPFHSHQANDELFYVLAGQGELRLGGARHAVKAGDLIACPAGGADTAHQLVNTGEVELRYLGISSMIAPEICEYPDSGKVGAYGITPAGRFAHLTRQADAADYWLGE